MPTPNDLIASPDWFPLALDGRADSVVFIQTSRAELSEAPMLDQRFDEIRLRPRAAAPMSAVPADAAAPPPGLIFHSAYCLSTLVARCLDRPGAAMSLKEPLIAGQIAQERRRSSQVLWKLDAWRARVAQVSTLLGRPFADGERVVVKFPYNANNTILDHAVARPHQILLMYSDLRQFLASVLNHGERRREFVRRFFWSIRTDSPEYATWPQSQAAILTDLQIAALAWRLQIEQFRGALKDAPPGVIATLHMDDFLADPAAVLERVAAHLDVKLAADAVAEQVEANLYRRHAKETDRAYGRDQRAAELARVEERYGADLDATVDWMRRIRPDFPLDERLPESVTSP